MIKAVVIDFDDTLCLTEENCFELENEVLIRMGREPMSREIHLKTWGKPLFETISTRSPGLDVNEFSRNYHQVIEEYVSSGKLDAIPKPNLAALDTLSANGKQLMILTSRTHVELKHILEPAHALAKRIDAFYYKDNMEFHKPDPRAFAELLKHHSLLPGDCVYVGDSISDADAANEAGLKFICSLESGIRSKVDFKNHCVDAFIHAFPDVVKVVKELDSLS